jgi:hypothetical protein
LEARGVVVTTKDLGTLPIPSIIIVDRTHVVVYQGLSADGDVVRFFEPATGQLLTAPREKVVRSWTGEAIVFDGPRLSPAAFWAIAGCAAGVTGLLVIGVLRVPRCGGPRPGAPVDGRSAAEVSR